LRPTAAPGAQLALRWALEPAITCPGVTHEGVYGYESCNGSGYLDYFNVSRRRCERKPLQCSCRLWSLSSRCSPRPSLSNKRTLSQLASVESSSHASTNSVTWTCLSNIKAPPKSVDNSVKGSRNSYCSRPRVVAFMNVVHLLLATHNNGAPPGDR